MRTRWMVAVACLFLALSIGACRGKSEPGGAGKAVPDWSRLKAGMPQDEVRKLLGEPSRQRSDEIEGVFWEYQTQEGTGQVRFDRSTKRVRNWTKPGG